jgi:hypothetical protein
VNRRTFIARSSAFAAGYAAFHSSLAHGFQGEDLPYTISLAEWSLHRSIFGGTIHPLEFPAVARHTFDIDAVEYVNSFFLPSNLFTAELKRRAEGAGVRNLLIMVDEAGRLGDPDAELRKNAIERHRTWLDVAHELGCASIRVNARSDGSAEEQMKLMADGLSRLGDLAEERSLNVLVENHGGFSSRGHWVAGSCGRWITCGSAHYLISETGSPPAEYGGPPRAGETATEEYDRYKGVDEMMPSGAGFCH